MHNILDIIYRISYLILYLEIDIEQALNEYLLVSNHLLYTISFYSAFHI